MYNEYRGIIVYLRVVDGTIREREMIRMLGTDKVYEAIEIGRFTPEMKRCGELGPGEVENNIFLHGNDLEGAYSNEEFARLVGNHIAIEFATVSDPDGRRRAVKAKRMSPEI